MVGMYITVTGAAWVVVSGNGLGVSNTTLLCILALHIMLSVLMTFGLWGMGNNFVQRLNLAVWLGHAFWPSIEKIGGPKFAW